MQNIGEFARDVLAPILGKTLGAAFNLLGGFISQAIDNFARFVSILTNVYNRIKSIVDAIKSVTGSIGGFFSGASYLTPDGGGGGGGSQFITTGFTTKIPSISDIDDSDARLRNFAAGRTTSITVNGAIDPESTARQIVGLLNDSSARGTLGGSGLVFA
jgi:hypothetical protein